MDAFISNSRKPYPLHWYICVLAATGFCFWYFDAASSWNGTDLADSQPAAEEPEMGETAPGGKVATVDQQDQGLTQTAQVNDNDEWSGLMEPELTGQQQRPEAEPSLFEESIADSGNPSNIEQVSGITSESSFQPATRLRGAAAEAALPASFSEALHDAQTRIKDGQYLESHSALSALYWKHPEHRELLIPTLQESAAVIFAASREHFGEPHLVQPGETLESISREYQVPWAYLSRLNRVRPSELQAGSELKVVRGPFGAVVDLSLMNLTVHAHGWYIQHYEIGTGKDDSVPAGRFEVTEKLENPVWYRPEGGVVAADDPTNPLGEYWIGLGDHIGIHGTIDPTSIGRSVSRGYIHLEDKDIEEVFGLLIRGSEVIIRP